MEAEFWKKRWEEGTTGWHKEHVHPSLPRFFPQMGLAEGDAVFVPLCGKSLDMVWLADQGMQVVGIEVSEQAILEFFHALGLEPLRSEADGLVCWQAGPYRLYEGDYFHLRPEHVAGVRAVYDRASLIALPKEGERGRKAYLQQMRSLFGADTKTLLITLDYDQEGMDGPPFSVDYEEVIWQYAFDHVIEFLDEQQILHQEPRFSARGLQSLTEWTFMLTRYAPIYAAFSDSPQNF